MVRQYATYNATDDWAVQYPDSCAPSDTQQSPIIIPMDHNSISMISTSDMIPFLEPNEFPFKVDKNISLVSHDIAGFENNTIFGLDLDVINPELQPAIIDNGIEYLLKSAHVHLGGGEHLIQSYGTPGADGSASIDSSEIDMTLHMVHHSKEAKRYEVLEYHIVFQDDAELDLGLQCPTVCHVCGKQGCFLHTIAKPHVGVEIGEIFREASGVSHVIDPEPAPGNICSIADGMEAVFHDKGTIERSNWRSWLGLDEGESSLLNYYSYTGGLTTPPCNQTVTFLIYSQPIFVKTIPDCDLLTDVLHESKSNLRPTQVIKGHTTVKYYH